MWRTALCVNCHDVLQGCHQLSQQLAVQVLQPAGTAALDCRLLSAGSLQAPVSPAARLELLQDSEPCWLL